MSNNRGHGIAKNQSSNFGARGWALIIIGISIWFFSGGTINDGQNTIVPALNATYGIDTAQMYTIASICAYIGIIGSFIGTWLVKKRGPKFTMVLGMAIFAVAIMLLGRVTNAVEFFLVYLVIHTSQNIFAMIGLSVMLANWFPTKKGLAMGWATFGANIGTAIYTQGLTKIMVSKGLDTALFIYGCVFMAFVVFAIIIMKDRPEDCGCFPDNDKSMTPELRDKLAAQGEAYKKSSPWTVKKLLKTKVVWIIGIAYGFIMLITMGTVSQLVPTIMSFGFTLEFALSMMTVAALIGIVFSYLFGWLDAKIGTKKASLIFYAWTMLAVLFMALPGKWTVYPAVFFMGGFLGAGNNLTMSITSTVFGRYDFENAWAVVYPITVLFRSAGYAIVGGLAAATGGYTVPYIVLFGVCIVAFILIWIMDDSMIGRNYVDTDELEA